jgi:arylsulfatase A-like enzyme
MTEERALPADLPTLAESLRGRGFATAGFVSGIFLGARFGLGRGFERYVSIPTRPESGGTGTSLSSTARVSAGGLEWLASRSDRPFFLFLHYFDVHSDYRPEPRFAALFEKPYRGVVDGSTRQLMAYLRGQLAFDEEDRQRLVDLYDAEVRQLDQGLEELFARLDQQGALDDTVVVVTADHGEELLDHGGVFHGRTQYQEMLHIPLIVMGPGIPRGLRSQQPVSLVDLAPTLLGLFGLEAPPAAPGRDLSPLWKQGDAGWPERDLFAEANDTDGRRSPLRAVRQGRWKLVQHASGERELFELGEDPRERANRAGAEPAQAAKLANQLTNQLGSLREAPILPKLTPDTRKQLEALGYVQE